MLKRIKMINFALAQKLTLLMLMVFLGGISLSGIALANILNYKAQHEISSNASLLFQSLNSVRSYTSNEVTPNLQATLGKDSFLPQTVPSYSSRKVFEHLRNQNQDYQDYLYKEAMLNPTNIRDLADDFEKDIVSDFRQNMNTQEKTGFRNLQGEKYFYIARPLKITDASCLRCHSTPDAAPQEMISIYGNKNGMGWKLNQINGTQIVSIPTTEVLQKAKQSFLLIMGIVTLVFAIAIYMANFWLKRYVVRPIKRVVRVAEAVSTGDMNADFEKVSNDEVGSLVEAFTRMKFSLVIAIRRLEQYRVENREPKDKF
ncbi:MAG: DUF3365 domain-containing protein [Methylacidiphilales bacterium]|nr:DUF3365 domain-containing protein [Candidatus Methylacidiphilales bacterium]NJR18203.1 DUF3365 domain-containing protein [Calothrix sp. CSU_2_0]